MPFYSFFSYKPYGIIPTGSVASPCTCHQGVLMDNIAVLRLVLVFDGEVLVLAIKVLVLLLRDGFEPERPVTPFRLSFSRPERRSG